LSPRAGLLGRVALCGALAALAPAASRGDDAAFRLKPGARGKVCLSCHTDFSATLQQASVHPPVSAGQCADCHDPHASEHGKLLEASPREICVTCHGDILPEQARSVHEVARSGECTSCHDPHASPHPSMLVQPGNGTCLACHDDLARALAAATYKHSPVEKSCLTCHDPHASVDQPAMLKKDERVLCTGCHATGREFFVKAHRGYPVAEARCTSCHDPHGSSNRGSLWATVHPPVASGLCDQCHQGVAAADPLATKGSGVDACRPCHAEVVNRTFTAERTHWPVVEGEGCLNCHGPHATRVSGLLRAEPAELCFGCHVDTGLRQAKTVTKHPPAEEGECATCHDPHAADATFLMVAGSVTETCAQCHDWRTHSSHPIGEEVIDPRNPNVAVDCESCHRSHGSAFPHLAPFDTDMELCVQCHSTFRR
jgi:DmsE family decaheme c-type cytochrome